MKLFKCQNKGCERQFVDAPMWFQDLKKAFFICPKCRPDVWRRHRTKGSRPAGQGIAAS